MSALLPCECGFSHNDPWIDVTGISVRRFRVRCSACVASTAPYTTEAEAISAWNRRTPPLPSREDVAIAIYQSLIADASNISLPDTWCALAACEDAADAVLKLLGGEGADA